MNGNILLEKSSKYAILTLNRPDAMNALNMELLSDIRNAVTDIARDPAIRVMIITGAGEKAFSAGADVHVIKHMSSDDAEQFVRHGHKTMNAIAGAELVSIAAINGFALGGGLELALACDIRITSKHAKFGLPEVSLGLIPGFGGTQRLTRVVGYSHALEMILSGSKIDAEEAVRIGLVSHSYDPASLMKEAVSMAESLITAAPEAQRMARWVIRQGLEVPITAGLEKEITSFSELFIRKDPLEGINAFLEKRPPVWK